MPNLLIVNVPGCWHSDKPNIKIYFPLAAHDPAAILLIELQDVARWGWLLSSTGWINQYLDLVASLFTYSIHM